MSASLLIWFDRETYGVLVIYDADHTGITKNSFQFSTERERERERGTRRGERETE